MCIRDRHNVLKYESAFVKDHDPYWSVILYYEEMNLQVNEVKNQKSVSYTHLDVYKRQGRYRPFEV